MLKSERQEKAKIYKKLEKANAKQLDRISDT